MLLSHFDRRVLATLKDSALKRIKPTPRIAVGGNCQSFGIAYAMKLLNVQATIHRYPMETRSKVSANMLVRALRTYDHVFLQDFDERRLRGGSSGWLRDQLDNATWYPTLLFSGYHPDSIFVSAGPEYGSFVWGPIGQHHSAIALFAYRAGLSPEAALRLYQREVFETLGYFDLWDAATAELFHLAKFYSLDLEGDFIRWTRRGCFMYSINHPKPYVLFDFARRLLEKAGIAFQPIDFDHYALDDFARDTIFPVYPGIGEHYGFPGSYVFKAPEYARFKIGAVWNLPDFLSESYRVYKRQDSDKLINERVQGWLDSPEISTFLKESSAEALPCHEIARATAPT
jgi:hypothetical protein